MIYNLTLKLTPPQPLPGLTPSPSPKGEGSLGRGVPTGRTYQAFGAGVPTGRTHQAFGAAVISSALSSNHSSPYRGRQEGVTYPPEKGGAESLPKTRHSLKKS